MNIKKVVKIELEPEEISALEKAQSILGEVCNQFPDCTGCPLDSLCSNSDHYPSTYIRKILEST
jgi:hypothetical protein